MMTLTALRMKAQAYCPATCQAPHAVCALATVIPEAGPSARAGPCMPVLSPLPGWLGISHVWLLPGQASAPQGARTHVFVPGGTQETLCGLVVCRAPTSHVAPCPCDAKGTPAHTCAGHTGACSGG